MTKQIPSLYGKSFETDRRLRPRFWDADYCLLAGLVVEIKKFVAQNVAPGMTVLDFGCGAKPYRSLFPYQCKYVGVDTCDNQHADFVINPGEKVPLADDMFDCVISTQVVYLIPDYHDYLVEVKRLLKPDGRLFISSHGTWTHHSASGGDYYRFTKDGLRYILEEAGFVAESMTPVVGTLGTGLHLRQLVFNHWFRKIPLIGESLAKMLNIFTNARICIEDKLTPSGTRISSPVIIACVARSKEIY